MVGIFCSFVVTIEHVVLLALPLSGRVGKFYFDL